MILISISLILIVGTIITVEVFGDTSLKNPNGWSSSSSGGGGQCIWATLSNIQTSNDAYSTCSISPALSTQQMNVTAFGFSIPSDATINGITAEYEAKSDDVSDAFISETIIQLMKINVSVGTNKAVNTITQTEQYYSHGGASDLWGTTWTPADINNAGFGLAIKHSSADDTNTIIVSVDHVRITVTYTPVTDTCTYSSGNWNVNLPDNCSITTTVNLGGNNLNINGKTGGTFAVNTGGNIINEGNVFFSGCTSTTNVCRIQDNIGAIDLD